MAMDTSHAISTMKRKEFTAVKNQKITATATTAPTAATANLRTVEELSSMTWLGCSAAFWLPQSVGVPTGWTAGLGGWLTRSP